MYRHLLVLPDGTEVFSGQEDACALRAVKVTQAVNSGQELALGSACACMMEAELITPAAVSLSTGDRVGLFRVDDGGERSKIGVFYLEQPTRVSEHILRLTAFDGVSRLDKDLTGWLADLDQWPYPVGEFAAMVCEACGVELVERELPNADFYIQPFAAEAVTGRHLIQWLGQIAGRFFRATADGKAEFAWYVPNDTLSVTPEEGEHSVYYYQGELTYEDYSVAPIEKVQLRQSSQDVGTVWPGEAGEKNTCILENNPMLAAQEADTLLTVAQTLYEGLKDLTYTPCRVTVPATPAIGSGDILSLTDLSGKTIRFLVMEKISDGMRDILSCTGSHRRDSTTAVNSLDFRALSGKVLNLRTDVEGMKVENKDTQGSLAGLELNLEGLRSTVERQEGTVQGLTGSVSTLTQRAESLHLELDSMKETGTGKVKTGMGYTFDDKGLHISRRDSDMENLLDHTGMYVRRSGQILLQANNQGVRARDVSVDNYLVIGDNARFEDYGGSRTACFYIG